MHRRAFLAAAGLAILGRPFAVNAQQVGTMYRIGLLGPARPEQAEPFIAAFRRRMRQHGWVEGQHFILDPRWAEGKPERFPELASDLARSSAAVIVAWSTPAVIAAKQVTTTIPIVMASSADAVGAGLVTSLSRPGGNVTGVSWLQPELSRKYPEFLREALPRLSRVAVLTDATSSADAASIREVSATSRALGLKVEVVEGRTRAEIENAFARVETSGIQAAIVLPGGVNWVNRKRIFELAVRGRVPTLYGTSDFVKDGGLMSYGADWLDLTRQAADYVDKILKGARPHDLPIAQPTKFELVINLKTAKALGLTIPPSLLARADQVIE